MAFRIIPTRKANVYGDEISKNEDNGAGKGVRTLDLRISLEEVKFDQ